MEEKELIPLSQKIQIVGKTEMLQSWDLLQNHEQAARCATDEPKNSILSPNI